jgi:hypothetical protein
MHIANDARAPVLRGRHGDFDAANGGGLPPVERADIGKSQSGDQVFHPLRNDGDRCFPGDPAGMADDLSQGRKVEVVHVGVREQHSVNGRQVLNANTGPAQAMHKNEPVGENRVNKEIEAAHLE